MARKSDELKASLLAHASALMDEWVPDGRVVGREFLAAGISGGTGSSFKMNLVTGVWMDFATGEKGGNLLEFYIQQRGIPFDAAYEELAPRFGLNGSDGPPRMSAPPVPRQRPPKKEDEPQITMPTTLTVPEYADPSVTAYEYRGLTDELLSYIKRTDHPDGKKDIVPYVEIEGRWVARHPPAPKPLYNLPALGVPTDGSKLRTVLLVSGEKCVDAVRALGKAIPHPCVTWMGGDQSIHKADWSPLSGRRVIYWYDADPSGIASIAAMRRELLPLGVRLKVIRIPPDIMGQLPPDRRDGADVADLIEFNLFDFELFKRMVREGQEIAPTHPDTPDQTAQAVDNIDTTTSTNRGVLAQEPTSDMAIADQLAAVVTGEIRYVAAWNDFYKWDGRRYVRDESMVFWEMAGGVIRAIASSELTSAKARKSLLSKIVRAAVVDLARTDPRVIVESTAWNRDPYSLNTPSGIVDLRTRQMRPHDRAALMTKLAGASPTGECPRWLEFLAEVLGDDVELIDWVQRLLGYCLTGSTQEEIIVFLLGPGGNGKGSFLETVRYVMGDYARSLPSRALTESKYERHPEELARLDGARLVTANEIDRGAYWNESLLKELTGGDTITARFMRQNSFEFKPEFKLIVAANNAPNLRGVDESMRRRIRMIAFNFEPPKPDLTLKPALRDEADGIMAWMLRGCIAWQEKGLADLPAAVTVATEQYFVVQDDISEWLEECCDCDESQWCPTNLQYSSYKSWVDERGSHALSIKNFVGELSKRRMTRVHRNWEGKRAWGYSGCRPRTLGSGSWAYGQAGRRHN